MHRQIKAALKARLVDASWMEELPLVLLGLRSAWREGPDTTPSELVYGESLRLPGQFVPGTAFPTPSDPFVSSFLHRMSRITPVPSSHHSTIRSFIPSSLADAKSVYVRHDSVRKPLQRPYDGPFMVLERKEKYFVIKKNGQPYSVSVDRLNPAYRSSS